MTRFLQNYGCTFEKQQAWLENIIQGKFSVIEQAIDQEQVVIESSQRRQWDYSSKGNPTSIEQNPILVRRKA